MCYKTLFSVLWKQKKLFCLIFLFARRNSFVCRFSLTNLNFSSNYLLSYKEMLANLSRQKWRIIKINILPGLWLIYYVQHLKQNYFRAAQNSYHGNILDLFFMPKTILDFSNFIQHSFCWTNCVFLFMYIQIKCTCFVLYESDGLVVVSHYQANIN